MKRILFIIVLVALATCFFILRHSFATTIDTITGGQFQLPDGTPCSGCFLYLTLSTDASVIGGGEVVSSGSPRKYQLDANGNLPSGATIWGNDQLSPANTYYIAAVTYSGGGVSMNPQAWSIVGASPINIGTMTQTVPSPLAFPSPVLIGANNTFTGLNTFTQTIQGTITNALTAATVTNAVNATNLVGPGSVTGTFSGNPTFSGSPTFSGTPTFSGNTVMGNLSVGTFDTSTIFADQLVPSSGLCSVTGSDASAKIQCAINLLPANGGVVNAINLRDTGGTGSTIIDPGSKSVTLYLGPYSYQIQKLVLETNFRIYGAGSGAYATPSPTTVLQACATCAAINTVVLGTNGGNGGAIQGVVMDGLRVYGATSDTAIGMNLKTVNGAGSGLWYSTFRNMCVGVCGPTGASANGFSGGAIILDGTIAGTVNQFLDFYNVQAFKTNGGGFALGLLGADGQINFNQSQFDGPTRNDGTTVVQIANSTGNTGPYTINFVGSTFQHGTTGVNIAGAQNITFIGNHFETVGGAIQVNTGVSSVASTALTFIGNTCQNFCGNNSASGFWAKNLSPASGTDAKFFGNQIQATVDVVYAGFSNFQGFTSIGDEQSTSSTVAPLSSIGMNIPILVPFTTTAVSSESVTVTGATASSHCWAQPTNATAAALTGVFLSAPTTNAVTLNHSATSGGTFNVFCTPN